LLRSNHAKHIWCTAVSPVLSQIKPIEFPFGNSTYGVVLAKVEAAWPSPDIREPCLGSTSFPKRDGGVGGRI